MTSRSHRSLPIMLLALVAAGCGAGEPATISARVETVDGEERWHYPATQANRLAWSFETLAVIGDAFTDDDAYQFDGVVRAGIAGDGRGDLYVLDRTGKRVLRFDRGGRHVATYGRAGRGPGELELPLALALGPGDSIWVSDVGNQRITVFPADGGDPRGIEHGGGAGMAPMEFRTWGGDYIHLVQALRRPGGMMEEDPPTPLVRFAPDGSVRDTIWELPPPRRAVTQTRVGGNVAVIAVPIAFAPARRWDLLSDGTVVISHTAEYSIALIRPDGTLLRRIERDPPPRATTDADREAERQRRAEQMQRGGGTVVRMGGPGGAPGGGPMAGAIERSTESMQFEPVIPRISALAVDGSDRIWVGVSLEGPGEVERIDIYAPDGTLLGELHGVPFPDRFFGPGLAARLVRDELDVQQVEILRLDYGRD